MIVLPTTEGWMVSWYTGEVRPRMKKRKDGTWKVVGEIRFKDSYCHTDKSRVEAKAKELAEKGVEVIGIYECIF